MAPVRDIQRAIVTTYGMDGACSAAMLLQIYPKSEIVITSARRIGATLEEIRTQDKIPHAIHICGVGISESLSQVVEQLRELAQKKRTVFWYCGRQYLNEYESALGEVCKPIFQEAKSNAEAIRIFHNIPHDERSGLLLSLALQFIDGQKKRSDGDWFWHNLIRASASRYFKYGDRSSYIQAIRKLAGIAPITEADYKEVDAFREYGAHDVPLGESKPMRTLRSMVQKIGHIDEPVLILGPTGSGKELVAWNLHEAGKRPGPFVPVNCAVLSASADLAHDRLFGHTAGAYTGAMAYQAGAFEEADGGTLFLDEVAELPPSVQTQLLRALEEGSITPLGTMKSRPVNVRIIAATNRNIPALIREGRFRSDLYYRLNVLQIQVPPLKDRLEDMKSIAQNLLYQLKKKGYACSLTKEDWLAAYDYDWPGNIRQFINLLKRAVYLKAPFAEVVKEEKQVDAEYGGARDAGFAKDLLLFRPQDRSQVYPESEVRKSYMKHVLALYDGNWTQAAEALAVSINTLRKWTMEN